MVAGSPQPHWLTTYTNKNFYESQAACQTGARESLNPLSSQVLASLKNKKNTRIAGIKVRCDHRGMII